MTKTPAVPFANYQNEIYLRGMAGEVPAFTTDPVALEAAAEEKLAGGPFWYVAGGAGVGSTVRANRTAFERWRLVPRMLSDASVRDLTTTLFGHELPSPLVLAPVGVQSIVHPDGELATARAAASLDIPMILSTASSNTMQDVAEANGDGVRWYQLYWPHDNDVTASLLATAKEAGYTALVVTLDTWTLGWRPHDLDQAYLPFVHGTGLAIPFADPVFCAGLAKPPAEDIPSAVLRWLPMFNGRTHGWDELAFLREHWDGPIVLKGILHADDARRAADAGMDGVVVSNHGGRQVDGAIGALDALPAVVNAVGESTPVLFDSGIRTGADAVIALALGARAVLLGRPYAYGLALDGEAGVRHVLRSLLADLDVTLGLTGYRTPGELTANDLARIGS